MKDKANLPFWTSKFFIGQVHYGHLLVPGQVIFFTISTPLLLFSAPLICLCSYVACIEYNMDPSGFKLFASNP